MKRLFLFILFCLPFTTFAQSDDDLTPNSKSLLGTEYVYLYTKDIVKGDDVDYVNILFKRNHFMVDDRRFEVGEVKFYQNERGLFGRVQDGFQSGYAERTEVGAINLFELEIQNYSGPTMGANGMMTGGYSGTRIIDYYNKGFGDLKRATYDNLRVDLSDKPEAQLYLDQYNKTRMLQNGFYVGCGALLVGSLVAFYNESQSNPQNFDISSTFVIAGLGAAAGFTGFIIGLEKKEKLKAAIVAYNSF